MVYEDQTHDAESQDKVSAQGGLSAHRRDIDPASYHPDGVTRVSWIEDESAMMLIFTPRATQTLFWLAYEVRFDEIVYFVEQLIPGVTTATNVISLGKEHHNMEFPIMIRPSRYVLWAIHAFLGELEAYMVECESSGAQPVLSSSKAYPWWGVISANIGPADWITRLPIDRNNRSQADVVRAAVQYRDEHLFPLEIRSSQSVEFDDFIYKIFPMFKLPLIAQMKVSKALRERISQMYCSRNRPWIELTLDPDDGDLIRMFVKDVMTNEIPLILVASHWIVANEFKRMFLPHFMNDKVKVILSEESTVRDTILAAPGLDSIVAVIAYGTGELHLRVTNAAEASKRKCRGLLVLEGAPMTSAQSC